MTPRLQRFRPRLVDALAGYTRQRALADVGAGLSVGIVALPLAMAFAIASGLKPEQGLITAIVAGFLISALGGSNVQIGGPAGAFIVVVYAIVERYGLTNLLIATALAGVLLFLLGLFRLGTLVRYIPVTIIIGFTNGIAVLIGLSQLKDLLGLSVDKMPADFFSQAHALWQHLHSVNPWALALGVATFAVLYAWPKVFPTTGRARHPEGSSEMPTPMRVLALVPGPVVALVAATLVGWYFTLPLETIGSRFGGIPRALPTLALPPFSWDSAKHLLIPTLTIALLGAIESLLCARVADHLSDDLPRHDPNQELMAQGVANMVSPVFGGMPATGTIARTVTNVRAGASTPVAGMVHAVSLLGVVLVAAPWAAHVPLAALAGLLLFVAWNMGEWREFSRLRQFSVPYRVVLLGTFVLTVVFDVLVAVEVGLVLACVFFIYRMSTLFKVQPCAAGDLPEGVASYELFGSLFFGAVGKLEALPSALPPGTRMVVLEMHRLISMDTSGLDALVQLHKALLKRQIALVLVQANEQPLSLIQRSGFGATLGANALVPDMASALARAPGR